jgi:hypothetical protein
VQTGGVGVIEDTPSGTTRISDADDPRVLYNRDREQMERNLESVRRALKTDSTAHKRDFEKMMRENVVLTRELNELRKEHHEMLLQKEAVDAATAKGFANADIFGLMELLGIGPKAEERESQGAGKPSQGLTGLPTGLPTGSVRGSQGGLKNMLPLGGDTGVWREVEIQNAQMLALERELRAVCASVGASAPEILGVIDRQLLDELKSSSYTRLLSPQPPASR